MRNSSVKWGHMGNFDLEPNKHNFPTCGGEPILDCTR